MFQLHIAHILSDLSVSSAASGVLNIMRWQQAQGQEAILLAGEGERLADAQNESLDVRLIDKRCLRLHKRSVDGVVQQLERWGADVLHAHRLDCLPFATEVSRRLDVPLIVNLQRCVDPEYAAMLREAPLAWLQVPNQAIRAHCINDLGMDRDRVVVLPFALSWERMEAWQRAQQRQVEVIGAVGNFDDLSGFEQICRAMQQLNMDGHALKAMFMGSGSGQQKLLRMIKSYKLQDHISIICGSSQMGRFLSIMDVLVYPGRNDAMSVVIMKAMACGLPVIAPALGGIPELVQHQKTGFLIPDLSQSALVSQLAQLRRDPTHLQAVTTQAMRMIKECYSTKAIGALYADLYDNAISGERHSTATRAFTTAFTRKTETILAS